LVGRFPARKCSPRAIEFEKGFVAIMKAKVLDHSEACERRARSIFLQIPVQLQTLVNRFPAISDGLLSLADQAIVSATSFATMVIIGRATSPGELGIYCLVASIVFFTVGVQEQIVSTPYTIYSKRRQGQDLATYAGSVWIHHFVLTAIGAALLAAVAVGVSFGSAGGIAPALWGLLAAGPFILLREWTRRFSFANLRIVPALALDMTVAVVQLGGLMLLWHLDALSIFNIVAVIGIACAIACVGWYSLDRTAVLFDATRCKSDWIQNWSLARWAVQSYVVGNTTSFVMPWILALAVGTTAAGVFGACNTLINISNVFLVSVDRVLTPRAARAFARGGGDDLKRVLLAGAWIVLPVLGAFCLVVFAIGGQLAAFVYGEQYRGHVLTLAALAAVMFMNGVGMIAGTGLWAIDRPRTNFAASVVNLVVTIASALVLIVPFGAAGAALSILAGTSTGSIVQAIRLRWVLPRTLTDACEMTQ
jgi:O-antigen/teichoic acid export membrane protein